MNYLKQGRLDSGVDEVREMARPLTPRSERPRSTWGSLAVSMAVRGLCPRGRCFRKEGHEGHCYPG